MVVQTKGAEEWKVAVLDVILSIHQMQGTAQTVRATTCFCQHPFVLLDVLLPILYFMTRYSIIDLVGSGGMGAVYKAVDLQSNNRIVAIKEMSMGRLTPEKPKSGM